MRSLHINSALAGLLLISQVLLSSVANASPIYVFPFWDDLENETIAEQMVFTDMDLSVTVTAWTTSYNTAGTQLESWQRVTGQGLGVYRDENGLGVISSDDDGNDLDGGSSGNYATDPDEGLLFVFSQQVRILDFFIGDLDSSDDFNLSVVNLTGPDQVELGISEIDVFGPPNQEEFIFDFGPDFLGTAFMLWVDGRSDDIEVLGVAAVPAPAPILILSLTLLAIGVRRRN
jgi:hypothetical protein